MYCTISWKLPDAVKYKLFHSYCSRFYGSELWDLNDCRINNVCVLHGGKGFSKSVGHFECKFQTEGALPTNHCWCQKTTVIALPCGIKISAVHCLILSQGTRVTDGRTDGQTTDGRT